MSHWAVIDSLYCAEQFFCSHLDSYGHYLAEAGESVTRLCLNQPTPETRNAPYYNADGFRAWMPAGSAYDVGFFLDGYAQAMAWPCEKRIAQVAAVCSPMPWDVRKPDGSPAFDLVISSIPAMVEQARAAGCRAEYQPLAFDLRARACMMGVKRDLDCIFIGSTGTNHVRRTRLLEELKDVVTVLPPVFGREYFRTLARAKVVLNVHAEWAQGAANAMRLFEAGGLGATPVFDGRWPDGNWSGFGLQFNGSASDARHTIRWAIEEWGPEEAEPVLLFHTYECDDRVPQLIRWAKEV